jgi:hypothetical protein
MESHQINIYYCMSCNKPFNCQVSKDRKHSQRYLRPFCSDKCLGLWTLFYCENVRADAKDYADYTPTDVLNFLHAQKISMDSLWLRCYSPMHRKLYELVTAMQITPLVYLSIAAGFRTE